MSLLLRNSLGVLMKFCFCAFISYCGTHKIEFCIKKCVLSLLLLNEIKDRKNLTFFRKMQKKIRLEKKLHENVGNSFE